MGRQRKREDVVRGARLKHARKQAGYDTAAEACDELDLHYTTYQAHESGWRAFDRKTARQYASLFRVNVDWLDEDIGPMRGGYGEAPDPLSGLSPGDRQMVENLIGHLKSKS